MCACVNNVCMYVCMHLYMYINVRMCACMYEDKQYHHGQLFDCAACGHGIRAFLNQVCCMNSDDVHPEKLVGVLVIQHLHFYEQLDHGVFWGPRS